MPKFTERSNPNTTLKVRESHVPKVFISQKALDKMSVYVDEAPGSDEIGWLGTAYREGSEFLIDDVFLFRQEVHGTTTEITPEGLEEFAMELLQQENGVEIWNNMKMWGHSHVNMSITPSGQDNSQMEAFSKVGHDFFIRLICNKKGEMGIDVYFYEEGLEFHNAPWETYADEQDEVLEQYEQQMTALEKHLEELKQQVGQYRQTKIDAIKEPIKAEIKEKVSKLVYQNTKSKKGTSNWANNNGYTNYYDYYDHSGLMNSIDVLDAKNYAVKSAIDGVKNTVSDFYSDHDLKLLANTCYTLEDFLEDAVLDGMHKMLSYDDLRLVWEKIMDIQDFNWGYEKNTHGYGY